MRGLNLRPLGPLGPVGVEPPATILADWPARRFFHNSTPCLQSQGSMCGGELHQRLGLPFDSLFACLLVCWLCRPTTAGSLPPRGPHNTASPSTQAQTGKQRTPSSSSLHDSTPAVHPGRILTQANASNFTNLEAQTCHIYTAESLPLLGGSRRVDSNLVSADWLKRTNAARHQISILLPRTIGG